MKGRHGLPSRRRRLKQGKGGKPKTARGLLLLPTLGFLASLAAVLYPLAAQSWYERQQDEVYSVYEASMEERAEEDLEAERKACIDYNEALLQAALGVDCQGSTWGSLSLKEDVYKDLLNQDGEGLMGYLTIPAIGLRLPVAHGTGEDALSAGVGHMPQSSLPVGGDGTHAILTGHTGRAERKLFTDLDLLRIGDYFTLSVLGQELTYEVDQIQVILPTETEALRIEPGRDYVTLLTCTPYGINTHRLLVRGRRVIRNHVEESGEAAEDPAENGAERTGRDPTEIGAGSTSRDSTEIGTERTGQDGTGKGQSTSEKNMEEGRRMAEGQRTAADDRERGSIWLKEYRKSVATGSAAAPAAYLLANNLRNAWYAHRRRKRLGKAFIRRDAKRYVPKEFLLK